MVLVASRTAGRVADRAEQTKDADIVVDICTNPSMLATVVNDLRSFGFEAIEPFDGENFARCTFASSSGHGQIDVLCPEDAFVRSEYYNDYLHHLGLLQCLAATLRNDGADSSNLSLFRETHGEPFGEEERKLLLILMPHLQRAFQLHTRIQGLERKAEAAEETLNELDTSSVPPSAQIIALVNVSRADVVVASLPTSAR